MWWGRAPVMTAVGDAWVWHKQHVLIDRRAQDNYTEQQSDQSHFQVVKGLDAGVF